MCGIFGAIGRSKDPKVTYDLLNSLYLKTEIRGTDATGFYACYPGNDSVIYDKEPLKASEYVKQRDIWNQVFRQACDVDLIINHCRQTSVGGGPEKINKNNHPHLSDDRRVAMVHNGKIPEFSALKGKYDVGSECDSEILLRMFESARIIAKDKETELKEEFPTLTPFLAIRLLGLKEIFSRVNYGAMAVAIAERGDDGSRYLWLFRDDERPLHVVDMRPTLGQIFYCSTAEIWRNAIEATPSVKQYVPQDQVIIEFPSFQIWLLGMDPSKEGEDGWNIRKFKITKTKYIDWKETEDEDDKLSFKRSKDTAVAAPPMKVVSRLGENEEIPTPPAPKEESGPPALPPASKDGGSKKKDEGGSGVSGGSGLGKSSVKAQVVVKADMSGRDPGDESEHSDSDTWDVDLHGPRPSKEKILTADDILHNAQPVDTEEIDMDMFNQLVEAIEKDLNKLKTEVHNKAVERSISNRDFSQVIDYLQTIRNEVSEACNHIA